MSEKGGKGFNNGRKSAIKTPLSAGLGQSNGSAKSRKGANVHFEFEDLVGNGRKVDKAGSGSKSPVKKASLPLQLRVEEELPENVKCVMNCEVAQILEVIQDQMVVLSEDPTIKLPIGGLLNATCGNAIELIIALLVLHQGRIDVLKYSLYGSVLSNLLLVLGSSLLCGGLANLNKEQRYDRKQADVNSLLLLLGMICHVLPLMLRYTAEAASERVQGSILQLSRASSIVMFIAYVAYLVFQLKTHQQFFEAQPEAEDSEEPEDKPEIGIVSGLVWLIIMTVTIALLSEYVVGTIEDASDSWGISVSFISIILLPIVGNAAEHVGSVIFAYKNKLVQANS